MYVHEVKIYDDSDPTEVKVVRFHQIQNVCWSSEQPDNKSERVYTLHLEGCVQDKTYPRTLEQECETQKDEKNQEIERLKKQLKKARKEKKRWKKKCSKLIEKIDGERLIYDRKHTEIRT